MKSRFANSAVIVAVLVSCASECLPIAAQEYGGNLTPPPPRPRRAYSTVDTYNYTHGGIDTTYSDSYKKARRVKKIRKLKQVIVKGKADDTTGKVTTGDSDSGNSTNGEDSDSANKSATKVSSESPKSGKPETTSKSDKTDVSDSSSPDSNAEDASTAQSDSNQSAGTKASNKADTKIQTSAERGAKLSSIPPPQMPPPPTSIGGFEMKDSSSR